MESFGSSERCRSWVGDIYLVLERISICDLSHRRQSLDPAALGYGPNVDQGSGSRWRSRRMAPAIGRHSFHGRAVARLYRFRTARPWPHGIVEPMIGNLHL